MQRVDCEKAIYDWNMKSKSEKQEEVEREINEKGYLQIEISVEQILLKQEAMLKEKAEIQKQMMKRYSEIEDEIVNAITYVLKNTYNVSGTGRYTNYDAIAESKIYDQDYLFEIKYCTSAKSLNAHGWSSLLYRIRKSVENYEMETNRKAKLVLFFIVAGSQEEVEKIKKNARNKLADEKDIILNIISETNIGSLIETDIIGNGIL